MNHSALAERWKEHGCEKCACETWAVGRGSLDFFDSAEGHIPVCTLLYVSCHETYIPRGSCKDDQIEPVAQMEMASVSCNAIPDANLLADSLKKIKLNNYFNAKMKARLPNASNMR